MKRHIVILGGGYAGYYTAREIESRLSSEETRDFEVTLVSRDNHFTCTPMLPSVPSSTLAPRHIVVPVRSRLSHTRFVRAEVTHIDPVAKKVTLAGAGVTGGVEPETLSYDELVVGLGSRTHFFGIQGAEDNALQMKTVSDAMVLRNRILDVLEAADAEDSARRRRTWLTIVVVGVGFSGCETAGELIEFLRKSIALYPRVTEKDLHVVLVGLDEECMPEIGKKLGGWARGVLEKDGVEVRLRTKVTRVAEDHVVLSTPEGKEERVETRCVVWTAGVAPTPAVAPLTTPGSKGRVRVDGTLRSPDFEGVWALGDAALVPNTTGEGHCPPTAQHAMNQASTAGKNVLAHLRGKPLETYAYKPRGLMASLGHHKAVALAFGIPIRGFVAWWLWRTYYLLRLPGFERKLRVALDWTIDLFLPRDTVVIRYDGGRRRELVPAAKTSVPPPVFATPDAATVVDVTLKDETRTAPSPR